MDKEIAIKRLISGSMQRAIVETIAGLVVLVFSGGLLSQSAVGSIIFFACLVILISCGIIIAMVWRFVIRRGCLQSHPVGDTNYWRKVFQSQAKLLWLVPLWYCGPLFTGLFLFIFPKKSEELIPFLIALGIFSAVFGWIIWLNRKAAYCLEEQARLLED